MLRCLFSPPGGHCLGGESLEGIDVEVDVEAGGFGVNLTELLEGGDEGRTLVLVGLVEAPTYHDLTLVEAIDAGDGR